MSDTLFGPLLAAIADCRERGREPGGIRISQATADEILKHCYTREVPDKEIAEGTGYLFGIPCEIVPGDAPPVITWSAEVEREPPRHW